MKTKKVDTKKIQQHFRAGLKQIELVSAKGQKGGLDGYHKFLKRKRVMKKVSIWLTIIAVLEFFICTQFRTEMLDNNLMNLFLWNFFSGVGSMLGATFAFMITIEPNHTLAGVKTVIEGIRLATDSDPRREYYPDEFTGWPDMGNDPLGHTLVYLDRRADEIDVIILQIERRDIDKLDERARLKKVLRAIYNAERVIEDTRERLNRVHTGLVKG